MYGAAAIHHHRLSTRYPCLGQVSVSTAKPSRHSLQRPQHVVRASEDPAHQAAADQSGARRRGHQNATKQENEKSAIMGHDVVIRDPREVIDAIRRKFNQEGTHSDPWAAEDAEENMRTIAGQAQLLSEELYTKPTHFLLELVQNADDCTYAADVKPQLLILLFQDGLLYASNETGFQEANVRAICDMAKSTKSRRIGAFTGEKGIGFKATAVVSECTYISSNGYEFCFDMRPGAYPVEALGLVCPRWEEDLTATMESWIDERTAGRLPENLLEGFGTRIWLQLKPECVSRGVSDQLKALDPFMLLNLRRLRYMSIFAVTPEEADRKVFSRSDGLCDDGKICISVQQGPVGSKDTKDAHHLVCLKKNLQVPENIASSEKKRAGVDEVELMFALPMSGDGSAAPDAGSLLFAFLPVKPYGFRFPIQADFVLPSNREGILENRSWNHWIRDQLAPAFVETAMAALHNWHMYQQQSAEALTGPSISSKMLLQYLPLPGEVQDQFLGRAAAQMLQLLQHQPCVLTESGQLMAPSRALLPSKVLQRADGRPLIPNEWLVKGLPDLEYVAAKLINPSTSTSTSESDGRTSQKRAKQVLLQLGCRQFTPDVLVSWLQADGTKQLLRQLPILERTSWLKSLYDCLAKLLELPADDRMSMANAECWGPRIAAAPILQLLGSQQMVSRTSAGQQVYLWDQTLGGVEDMKLFISKSTSLQFVNPETVSTWGAAALQQLLGLQVAQADTLVEQMLQMQETWSFSNELHLRQLLFFFSNRSRLRRAGSSSSSCAEQQLQKRLSLRVAAEDHAGANDRGTTFYNKVNSMYIPLTVGTNNIPADLSADLAAAGVKFAHQQYVTSSQRSDLADASAYASELWAWFKRLGMKQLTPADAVLSLLSLYDSKARRSTITAKQHLQHIRFMSTVCSTGSEGLGTAEHARLQAKLQSSLYLYELQQDAENSSPTALGKQLYWSLGRSCSSVSLGISIEQQLREAGVHFVHTCYYEGLGNAAGPVYHLLMQAGVLPAEPTRVLGELLQLHKSNDQLQATAARLGLTVQELLLQQLQYLADVRGRLSASQRLQVVSMCSEQFRLHDSADHLVLASQLHLPPSDAADTKLLSSLGQAGSSVKLLSDSYAAFASDQDQRLVLTQLLGVQQADAATIIHAIAQLHNSRAELSQAQRMCHLAYLARYDSLLQENEGLLRQVQQAFKVPSSLGGLYLAHQLFFPLGEQYSSLQDDMDAAGMLFLNITVMDNSSNTVDTTIKTQLLRRALVTLGVKSVNESRVTQHILKLYTGQIRVQYDQHVAHVCFIAANWHLLNADTQAMVTSKLKLRVLSTSQTTKQVSASDSANKGSRKPGCEDAGEVVWALGTGLYQLPQPDSNSPDFVKVLQLAGLQFLHPGYTAAEQGDRLLQWMTNYLKLQCVTRATAAESLLVAIETNRKDYIDMHSWSELAEHVIYMADHWDPDDMYILQQALILGFREPGSDSTITLVTAAEKCMYWPNTGGAWKLQEVLLPSEVTYLHPVYAERVQKLASRAETRAQARRLQEFFINALGVFNKPKPESAELQQAIAAGGRWQPLLLLFADKWESYTEEHQQLLAKQLRNMQVACSAGTRPLSECFLATSHARQLLELLSQHQLPLLELPNPEAPHWSFLKQCGVSTSLEWPDVHKLLKQLRVAEETPTLHSMQQLYEYIGGLCKVNPTVVDTVKAAFASEPLIFMPSPSREGGYKWVRSRDVLWTSNINFARIFTGMDLKWCYKKQQPFFQEVAGVQTAGIDDLKGALLTLAQQETVLTSDVVEQTQLIYTMLATHAARQEVDWLPDFFIEQPVLLVSEGSTCRFTTADSHIYIPDNAELAEMFKDSCTMLHMHADMAPALQPLLQHAAPELPLLSTSVVCSCRPATTSKDAVQLDEQLTDLVHSVLPYAARYLYCMQPTTYMKQYDNGELKLLRTISVYNMPGLVEDMRLGDVQKHRTAYAAVQKQQTQPADNSEDIADALNMFVDSSSCTAQQLLSYVAQNIADFMCGASNASRELATNIQVLLLQLYVGCSADAENQLKQHGIGQIPERLQVHAANGMQSSQSSAPASSQFDDSDDDIAQGTNQQLLQLAAEASQTGLGSSTASAGMFAGSGSATAEHDDADSDWDRPAGSSRAGGGSTSRTAAHDAYDMKQAVQQMEAAAETARKAYDSDCLLTGLADTGRASRTSTSTQSLFSKLLLQARANSSDCNGDSRSSTRKSDDKQMMEDTLAADNLANLQELVETASQQLVSGRGRSTDAQAQRVGAMGECFLFSLFSKILPGFDESCWVSGNKAHMGFPAPAKEPSCDFLYHDTEGKLTGKPGVQCVIECKATSMDAGKDEQQKPVAITTHEWKLAQQLHKEGSAGVVYMIVRVVGVKAGGHPSIARILKDPVQLLREGKLGITGQQLQLTVL